MLPRFTTVSYCDHIYFKCITFGDMKAQIVSEGHMLKVSDTIS